VTQPVPIRLWPRGLSPALVLIALIWRAGEVVDAATQAIEFTDSFLNPDQKEQ
jgi:hypothetical protein